MWNSHQMWPLFYRKMEPDELTYEERIDKAKPLVGFPGPGIDGDTALGAIGLMCYLTQQYRKKNPDTKPFHILTKIYGKPKNNTWREWYMQYSILCEIFLTEGATFSTHGLKTVAEISEQIKIILDQWMPF